VLEEAGRELRALFVELDAAQQREWREQWYVNPSAAWWER
jgi:hypothetical protein